MKTIDEEWRGPHNCPVCGKHVFKDPDPYESCPVCDWIDNLYQRQYPDEGGLENRLSLNEAKEQHERYGTALPFDLWGKWAKRYKGWEKKLKNIDRVPESSKKYLEFLSK